METTTATAKNAGSFFVVLGCGAAKQGLAADERVPAIDLYTGSLYTARREYAESVFGKVDVIASAFHGALEPQQEIGTYDSDLRKLDAKSRFAWAVKVASYIASAAPKDATIVLLCSGPYAEIRYQHALAGRVFFDPCARTPGMGLGEQKKHLTQLARDAKAARRSLTLDEERAWWAANAATVAVCDECIVSGAFMRELLTVAS